MGDYEFNLEILAQGGFVDDSFEDADYRIDTWTVRLNWQALNEYMFSRPASRDEYPSEEAYELNRKLKETRRKLWEDELRKALSVAPGACFSYSRIVSEIFGACLITKMEEE